MIKVARVLNCFTPRDLVQLSSSGKSNRAGKEATTHCILQLRRGDIVQLLPPHCPDNSGGSPVSASSAGGKDTWAPVFYMGKIGWAPQSHLREIPVWSTSEADSWERRRNAAGHVYFYNALLGESVWEKTCCRSVSCRHFPDNDAPANSTSSRPAADHNLEPPVPSFDDVLIPTEECPSEHCPVPYTTPYSDYLVLPGFWERQSSKNSTPTSACILSDNVDSAICTRNTSPQACDSYFYNGLTNQVKWTLPSAVWSENPKRQPLSDNDGKNCNNITAPAEIFYKDDDDDEGENSEEEDDGLEPEVLIHWSQLHPPPAVKPPPLPQPRPKISSSTAKSSREGFPVSSSVSRCTDFCICTVYSSPRKSLNSSDAKLLPSADSSLHASPEAKVQAASSAASNFAQIQTKSQTGTTIGGCSTVVSAHRAHGDSWRSSFCSVLPTLAEESSTSAWTEKKQQKGNDDKGVGGERAHGRSKSCTNILSLQSSDETIRFQSRASSFDFSGTQIDSREDLKNGGCGRKIDTIGCGVDSSCFFSPEKELLSYLESMTFEERTDYSWRLHSRNITLAVCALRSATILKQRNSYTALSKNIITSAELFLKSASAYDNKSEVLVANSELSELHRKFVSVVTALALLARSATGTWPAPDLEKKIRQCVRDFLLVVKYFMMVLRKQSKNISLSILETHIHLMASLQCLKKETRSTSIDVYPKSNAVE